MRYHSGYEGNYARTMLLSFVRDNQRWWNHQIVEFFVQTAAFVIRSTATINYAFVRCCMQSTRHYFDDEHPYTYCMPIAPLETRNSDH